MSRTIAARLAPCLLLFLMLGPGVSSAQAPADGLTPQQRAHATRLLGEALLSDEAYSGLRELCDGIGHRLSGSPRLDSAITWAMRRLERQGFQRVRAESAMVPAWERGEESLTLIAPTRDRLAMLGLGMSVGTPPGGIEAEVIAVSRFSELDSIGREGVAGRIVLYDVPFTSYAETVRYRSAGASRAARLGAVAALVRSVGPRSLDTPHTGALSYADSLPRIPAAAVSIEAASRLARMARAGARPRVRLEMGAKQGPDAVSHNVVADLPGRDLAHEIVLVSGHLDSWDVGEGAQDDGAGCLIAMEAAHLLRRLAIPTRRTVRVVLWTNEENGTRGARAYRDRHRAALADHVAVLESDSGNGPVQGFQLDLRTHPELAADSSAARGELERTRQRAQARLGAWRAWFEPLGATRIEAGGAGADVGHLCAEGAPGLGIWHDTRDYFDIHHTHADTFEKIDRMTLRRNVAAVALMLYFLADSPERLRLPVRSAAR